ncbi:hypothetical protein C4J88_2974 [Pseudomonas sp. R4-39-08]|uniref:hypothetical protein n=1 Tax=Pseudomonas sp. R4-39-08 TaxID=1173288 RepID=UPI000F71B54B|nr:hypothetical protein [Pseudomonas sp. R4-39-08]AZF37754.1 hypothetical protein C4J88_2974 [Pseudomonas sp. R4-39-08]
MTANQTIDGVPREAAAALEKARDVLRAIIIDKAAGVHYASAQSACHQINHVLELRALLDAKPDYPECSGNPASCPENEGFGCCKDIPSTPAPYGWHVVWADSGDSYLFTQAERRIEILRLDTDVRVIPLYAEQPAPFQSRVEPWMLECFGEVIAADRQERNHRFLEEALEVVQAFGCTANEANQLVDYVYGRHAGEPSQEVGGVMVTLAALCLAGDLDMHAAGEAELARIWTKVDQIRAKQAAKPAMSPLPGAYPDREQPAPVAAAPINYGALDPVERLAVCRGNTEPAALTPATFEKDRIKGMIETVGGEYAVMIDQANRHYGWTFKKHPDGQWVSGRLATEAEMNGARAHAQITNQL